MVPVKTPNRMPQSFPFASGQRSVFCGTQFGIFGRTKVAIDASQGAAQNEGVLEGRMRRILAAACVMFAVLIAAVNAQTSHLSGTVRDTSASLLPGVTVTVSGPALDKEKTTTTDHRGEFTFKNLPPDDAYVVTFALAGFRTVTQRKVALTSEKVTATDAVLTVADIPSVPRIIPDRYGFVPLSPQ